MILRRLSQSLKEQNWMAIVIEFVLLVLGVFLGIQVANWNEGRKESIQEAAYLNNLAEDIRSDIIEIDETIAVSTWRMSIFEALAFEATGEYLPSSFKTPEGIFEIQKAPVFSDTENTSVGLVYVFILTLDGNRSTYETIVNTGGISLIQDVELLQQIQLYYAAVDVTKDVERKFQIDCDNALLAIHEAGTSPVDTNNISDLSKVLANNPKLLASSKTLWGSTGNQIKTLLDLRQQANTLLDEIEKRNRQ